MNCPLSPHRSFNQSAYQLFDQTQSIKPFSINPTVRFTSVSDFFEKQLGITPFIAVKVHEFILQKQKSLRSHALTQVNESYKLLKSDNFPYEVVITKNRIHVFTELVASGTSAKVYKTYVLTTSRHQLNEENFSPFTVKIKAVKETKGLVGKVPTFTPEKKRLGDLRSKRGLDFPDDTFKQPDGHGYSMHDLYDKDLTKVNFHFLPNPVSFILNMLTEVCRGLKNLHDVGVIHRDIKGANIVIRGPTAPEENLAETSAELAETIANVDFKISLTDFGLVKLERDIAAQTTGTEYYLDPALFGTLEECLVNQKARKGHQTKQHDIYALGITLFRDVLMPYIKDQSLNLVDPELQEILKKLNLSILTGPFTDEQLRESGKNSNYRIIYYHDLKKDIEYLIKYPELIEMSKNLKEAIYRLNNLSLQTKEILMNLSDLCCLMQMPKENRPTIEQVIKVLEKIKECSDQTQLDGPLKRVKVDFEMFAQKQKNPVSIVSQTAPTQISSTQISSTQMVYSQ